jgi:hypothetical protein
MQILHDHGRGDGANAGTNERTADRIRRGCANRSAHTRTRRDVLARGAASQANQRCNSQSNNGFIGHVSLPDPQSKTHRG